ncbi:FGGY family carbohydrate kinase [Pseudactinotalea sp. HY160]|uniref:FGGY family carbohydrate kinase n=1 Tax=Pseudactinotalea sp. HY160 TaxID=2654490 RepID=UPI00351B2D39
MATCLGPDSSPTGRIGHDALAAGLDLGSTSIKLLVVDEAAQEVVSEQIATPWRAGNAGTTEMTADGLIAAVRALLKKTSARLETLTRARVSSIAIAGMGESGILIDRAGSPVTPAIAWFDPREPMTPFPERIRDEFSGRTGLPLGAQVSVSKLAYFRDQGLRLDELRWLNLPEFVAMSLGGDVALEYSLTSRTGLLDQDTGAPWPEILKELGATAALLPPLREAGDAWGRAVADLPSQFSDSRLTVAGHDHLVAMQAGEDADSDRYHVSMGTAEVLVRVIDTPLGFDARSRLAANLINEVRHVIPGKHVLVAGVKTGLLLRRALQLAGITDRSGRDRLDDAVMALPYRGTLADGGVMVSGARNDDGVLQLAIRTDDVNPAEIFAAILRHSNDEIALLLATMDRELPPAQSSTLTGGWASMRAVQRARDHILPNMSVSTREQETAFGAARTALRLAYAEPTLR